MGRRERAYIKHQPVVVEDRDSIVCCGYDQQWITGPTDYFIRNDRDVLVSFQNPGEFCLHKRINPQNVLTIHLQSLQALWKQGHEATSPMY